MPFFGSFSHFFNGALSNLDVLKNILFENQNICNNGFMQKSFNNDQGVLMKTKNSNTDIIRKKITGKKPKVILEQLNISEGDSIIILNNKMYIEKTEMTDESKSGKRDLIVKGGKVYEEYKRPYNCNAMNSQVEWSLLLNNTKTRTHLDNAKYNSLNFHGKPLRQINGNVDLKHDITLSTSASTEKSDGSKARTFWTPQSLYKNVGDDQSPCIQKGKIKRTNGFLSTPVPSKPLKRLINTSPKNMLNCLKNIFFSRNHSNSYSSFEDPFRNWSNDKILRENDGDSAKKSYLKSPRKSDPISQSPKVLKTDCEVTLERIDAKICFMDYLRLKPTVRTDVHKMYELSLLRRHKIKNCRVVISRKPLKAGVKR